MTCADIIDVATAQSAPGARRSAPSRRRSADGGRGLIERRYFVPDGWEGRYGAPLGGWPLRLRAEGRLDGPAVFVLGGISASRVVSGESDGWWRGVVKRGGGVDLDRYCAVSIDYPPAHTDIVFDLCPEDFADLFAFALNRAGVRRLHAFIGASFGGMIGLAFGRKHPERLNKLGVVSAAHRPHPMAQAWRCIQREIIAFAVDRGAPEDGVRLARKLAMTTYRTPEEFAQRFDVRLGASGNVSRYLAAHGDGYAQTTSAARYTTLSAAIDRHDETPEAIKTPTLLVGVDSDRLAPLCEVRELHERIGGPSSLNIISSVYGHDAFLKEAAALNPILEKFLNEGLS
ncbi:MAG: homoserine O-succinyltransferase MetX [Hyphococcus sp.]